MEFLIAENHVFGQYCVLMKDQDISVGKGGIVSKASHLSFFEYKTLYIGGNIKFL